MVHSPFQARQLLTSGLVSVNGKIVSRSSYHVSPGDLVALCPTFAGPITNGGKHVAYLHKSELWENSWFAFSQTKALSLVVLRYPKPSEIRLPFSPNPQAFLAF
jgi:ribosomal protein S4